ncbi:MAG: glutamine--fructose-6-phosphate transaminase (isomerizing) [Candidatus Comchoanobacterales bacterium]
MCGIVAGILSQHHSIQQTLLEGLKALSYRGYDSAGMALVNNGLKVIKAAGKVQQLESKMMETTHSHIGIAHTRWATHGLPTIENAHPHVSHETIAIVHNGIIENHESIREELLAKGYLFESETDSEVIAHLLHSLRQKNPMKDAMIQAVQQLKGSFAMVVIDQHKPEELFAAVHNMPLVLGIEPNGYWLASDIVALPGFSKEYVFFHQNTLIQLSPTQWKTFDHTGKLTQHSPKPLDQQVTKRVLETHKHFMHQEIFEQLDRLPKQMSDLESHHRNSLRTLLENTSDIHIIGCGSSYHAGLVSKYWIEKSLGILTQVSIASEFRYQQPVVRPSTLIIAISQSGETADTIAALSLAQQSSKKTLVITNVMTSTMANMSPNVLPCLAGIEQSVAATKSFSSQLVALSVLASATKHANLSGLMSSTVETILQTESAIKNMASSLESFPHAFFIGRDVLYPVAMEGALKLKEISYIHAESYAAGELKHGPLALIDQQCPTVAMLHPDCLPEKMHANIEEILARRGPMFIIHDERITPKFSKPFYSLALPETHGHITPIAFSIALQLLSYHVAKLKGLDIDQPRNLAKCVTVE